MNFIKTYTAFGSFIGRCRRQVVEVGSWRTMCSKPEPPPSTPAPVSQSGFRIPGYRPSKLDKKIFIWSGRFKTPEQIPELVSFEMLDAARNRLRVKVCYGMMVVAIGACLVMIFLGKQAAGRQESLTSQNIEKKMRWREEMQRDKEAAAAAGLIKPQ